MEGESSKIANKTDTQQKPKLIISDNENQSPRSRTIEARKALHRLIVRFRKNSEKAEDPGQKTLFRIASDILASLARLFKVYEKNDDEPNN